MKYTKHKFSEIFDFQKKSNIKAGDGMQRGKFQFFTSSPNQTKFYDSFQHDTEGLIFGTGGSPSLHYCNKPFSTSTDCLVAIPKIDVVSQYVYYYLLNNIHLLEKGFKGAGLKHIAKKYINEIIIVLPSITEQRHIVTMLDKANILRRKRKESVKLLDKYLEAVFVEMFGDPLINPKEWKIEKLNDVCDVRDGTHDSPKYHETGYPLVTSKNVKDGYIDFSTAKLISKKDFQDVSRRSAVDNGDIIMPMIGTIGNPVIVEKDREFAIKNVALIKFTRSPVLNVYIQFLLGDRYLSHQIKKKAKGGTQKFLSLSDIRSLEIPIPDLELQQRFSVVYEISKKIKMTMKIQSNELENHFNAVSQNAFAGAI